MNEQQTWPLNIKTQNIKTELIWEEKLRQEFLGHTSLSDKRLKLEYKRLTQWFKDFNGRQFYRLACEVQQLHCTKLRLLP